MSDTRYAAPARLEEALQLLGEQPASVLAGGTDLMPQWRAGRRRLAPLVLSLRGLEELRGISEQHGRLRLGARTLVCELETDPRLLEHAAVLVEAARCFASPQIRHGATLGGNLCNASPAADLATPLLLLEATVEVACWRDGVIQRRELPIASWFTGPGRTELAAGELLVAVQIPKVPNGWRARFVKFGTRPALDISVVSVAAGACVTAGQLSAVRVALGAVAPVPLRARACEAALVQGASLAAAAAIAAEHDARPIDDVRATAWYRRELVRTLLRRQLEQLVQEESHA
jgi:CO/xanthine dehydrogenase FAD-binding subunit